MSGFMDVLFQAIDDPLEVLLPLAYGLAVFALLMLIYRWLRRFRALSWVAIPYTIGALTLGAALGMRVMLDRAGAAIDGGTREVLLAVLVICWWFVRLGLGAERPVDRWSFARCAAIHGTN